MLTKIFKNNTVRIFLFIFNVLGILVAMCALKRKNALPEDEAGIVVDDAAYDDEYTDEGFAF